MIKCLGLGDVDVEVEYQLSELDRSLPEGGVLKGVFLCRLARSCELKMCKRDDCLPEAV